MTHRIDRIEDALASIEPDHCHESGHFKPRLSLADEYKHAVAARLIHNLSLEQMENLERITKKAFKESKQSYIHF